MDRSSDETVGMSASLPVAPLSEQEAALGRTFDGIAREGEMRAFTDEEQPAVQRLLARWELAPGMRVLEPGCGAGRLTERLAAAVGPTGEVVALDLSAEMLRLARERRLPAHVRLMRGSAYAVDSPDDHFDRVLCFCVFPHFEEPARALRELARVLQPGGSLWINHLASRESINAFHRQVRSPLIRRHRLPEREALAALLREAGLSIAVYEDGDEGYCVRADRPA